MRLGRIVIGAGVVTALGGFAAVRATSERGEVAVHAPDGAPGWLTSFVRTWPLTADGVLYAAPVHEECDRHIAGAGIFVQCELE